jgi:hypothetical protein
MESREDCSRFEGARFARHFDYKENKPREARTLNDK